jgi:hypothetical protein
MYTQTYDFDISGADTLFFRYTYDPEKGRGFQYNNLLSVLGERRVIPIQGWQKQKKISGKITDRITIYKKPDNPQIKVLRVEGVKEGKNGFFEKSIQEKTWKFVPTNQELKGMILENTSRDSSHKTLGIDNSSSFTGDIGKLTISIPNFHYQCTPNKFIIRDKKTAHQVTLKFHHHPLIRLAPRAPGLSDKELPLKGAIEVPDNLKIDSPEIKKFILKNFKKQKFTNVKISATLYELVIKKLLRFKWKLQRVKNPVSLISN